MRFSAVAACAIGLLVAPLGCVAGAYMDWADSEWISAADAPVHDGPVRYFTPAAKGTSVFLTEITNAAEVVRARWTTTGLGVYELFVNGRSIGNDAFLKPGLSDCRKTRYAYTYDITEAFQRAKGACNVLGAEVSAGWWRDNIVSPDSKNGFAGRKSAFRGVLRLTFADGTERTLGTNVRDWRAGTAGPVLQAGIYDGETYDARVRRPVRPAELGKAEVNREFGGEILPATGGVVRLRFDLARKQGPFRLQKGKPLVVDFGQNCAAIPFFRFRASRGTVLTCLPGEMLNDADRGVRGCDGPKGAVYRWNLVHPDQSTRLVYTFAGDGTEEYHPRFTYFGYRYVELRVTEDVEVESVTSVPVSSIEKDMEIGRIKTGDATLNRFIENVLWTQRSNFLSVPTDCPQRTERLGWNADAQIFSETSVFNADLRSFYDKFARDQSDNRDADGGYTSTAPFCRVGNEGFCFGWADAGIIIPHTVWRQYGHLGIVRDNYEAMSRFVRKLDETKYDFEGRIEYIWADWLSAERYESCGNRYGSWYHTWRNHPDAQDYRRYLAACYWLYDATLMAEMAAALGKREDAAWFEGSAARARAHIKSRFIGPDGLVLEKMRDLQTACVFALHFDLVEGAARKATLDLLLGSLRKNSVMVGILGNSFLMGVLVENGCADIAYGLLLRREFPSWLSEVEQGATTVWERMDGYSRETGFHKSRMNSFNHYVFGAVVGWLYRYGAGIVPDAKAPGFRHFVLRPYMDSRLGSLEATYRSVEGEIRSAWTCDERDWTWTFTIPAGTSATVVCPGETVGREYAPGTYSVHGKRTVTPSGVQ